MLKVVAAVWTEPQAVLLQTLKVRLPRMRSRNCTSRTPFNYLGFLALSPASSYFQNSFLTLHFFVRFSSFKQPIGSVSDTSNWVQVYRAGSGLWKTVTSESRWDQQTICWLRDNWTSANLRAGGEKWPAATWALLAKSTLFILYSPKSQICLKGFYCPQVQHRQKSQLF